MQVFLKKTTISKFLRISRIFTKTFSQLSKTKPLNKLALLRRENSVCLLEKRKLLIEENSPSKSLNSIIHVLFQEN